MLLSIRPSAKMGTGECAEVLWKVAKTMYSHAVHQNHPHSNLTD